MRIRGIKVHERDHADDRAMIRISSFFALSLNGSKFHGDTVAGR
jgi:hypothetical protein